jgi:hypothetical protein
MFHVCQRALASAIALSVAASVPARTLAASSDTILGYVVDYQGKSSAFAIQRGTQTISVAPTQILDADDKVVVSKPTGDGGKPNTITIDVGGRSHVIDAQSSPFCVGSQDGKCGGAPEAVAPETLAALAGLKNLLSGVVAPALREAKVDYDSSLTAPLRARGPGMPPSLPILLGAAAYVPANLAMLVIPISGGNPPLQVALFTADGTQPISQQHDLTDTDAHLAVASLPVGKYRIQVRDASNASASRGFEAVAGTAVPAADPSLQVAMDAQQAFVRDVALTGYATFLQTKGWYLTAYQTLQKTSADFPPAHDLLFRLREGP